MKESTLCGYLKIKGLTSEFPELTVSSFLDACCITADDY